MAENSNTNDEFIIDVDALFSAATTEHGNRAYVFQAQSPVIHKIQHHINCKDVNVNRPSIISIGPYHHGTHGVCTMQERKWRYLQFLLKLNPEKKLADYIEAINGIESRARSCYADEIRLDKDSFVKMLLLDGCFLLLSFNGLDNIVADKPAIAIDQGMQVGASQENEEHTDDFEYGPDSSDDNNKVYFKLLSHDILLFENQIPFFVLEKLHETATLGRRKASFLQHVVQSLEVAFDFFPKVINAPNPPEEFHHLLQLFHMHLKPCQRNTQSNDIPARETSAHWQRATEYQKVGIALQKREFISDHEPNSLLDIRFCNGTLEIPCLTFDQEIAGLFQNLIAFEHACPKFGNYITAYAVFWSQFSGTADDVALLIEKGIIVHHACSDTKIANLLRVLSDCVWFNFDCDYYLKCTHHLVEAHYQNQRSLLRKFISSGTSKIHHWTRQTKDELPTTLRPV